MTPAGFYAWLGRQDSAHAKQDRCLLTEIERLFLAHEELWVGQLPLSDRRRTPGVQQRAKIDDGPSPMTMRVVRPLLLLPLVACGGGGADCVALPCPQPVAISLTIASTVAGGGVPVATVDVSGAVRASFSCSATCPIAGSAGTYQITVSAPGFAPVERSVQVRGTNSTCGCATTVIQDVTIALSASATSILDRDRAPAI